MRDALDSTVNATWARGDRMEFRSEYQIVQPSALGNARVWNRPSLEMVAPSLEMVAPSLETVALSLETAGLSESRRSGYIVHSLATLPAPRDAGVAILDDCR